MLKFAANLSMMYTEHAFLDRYAAAAADGYTGVECMFPYEAPAAFVRERMDAAGVTQVLFNAPPGVAARGERGLAALPGRQEEFQAGIEQALCYATALACQNIHVMAGLVPPDASREAMLDCYRENLDWAARQARSAGVTVLIEPINTRDIPGYFLNRQDDAHAVVQTVNAPNLKVQMDLYHCQIVEGDVTMKLREYLPTGRVGHLQIAGVPLRQEPDRGELDYGWVFDVLRELRYSGWIGCEYRPAAGTSAGLRWLSAART
ncbi:hydroxypyruvate isomerase family protein [Achromobacter insolitus]|jgi:hydroxypyruvate isomerase|uniref:2-oxo-tetronate isomerase n=1 Tax=Achromobacter insolitus TaxID=217204 RepID=UPI0007C86E12|nr:2-oxo-tetronate isomerase [Achromobacter insolitus]GLK94844.1 hydroxypyruvate isomerase [Achromobacter xylosoxidans]OAE59980.1 hydroxypyruvate isomerase [Achromobacter insolitus]OCZ62246.1 hydroxypyruvate isomerase [Achromobacter insolitus]WKK17292.1 hydroxypyruvate isomerase family protein [Achromobacter insolitus]CAB3944117.1 2-oxo-tetronate isomerase [Achromobacter insolitus]